MTAKILDGKKISEQLREQLREEVQTWVASGCPRPGLAVVLVGQDEASKIYVRNKTLACKQAGIESFQYNLPETCSPAQLQETLQWLNQDPQIHGILVQMPLPKALANFDVMEILDPRKDVDGFHPVSLGRLLSGKPGFRPCTPFGVMKILEQTDLVLEGKHAVIVGRSTIVGKPMGLMLLEKNMTVTYCHSKTRDLAEQVGAADVVVAAVGVPELVRGAWIKPGATVIDVGINRGADGKLLGDVEFAAAAERAAFITPVPGGVGPLTIAMLLWNTFVSAKQWAEAAQESTH